MMGLAYRNTEVQHAVDELIRLVDTFPRENMEPVDPEDISMFKQHHSKLMYKVRIYTWQNRDTIHFCSFQPCITIIHQPW